jgi:hypothetical protein
LASLPRSVTPPTGTTGRYTPGSFRREDELSRRREPQGVQHRPKLGGETKSAFGDRMAGSKLADAPHGAERPPPAQSGGRCRDKPFLTYTELSGREVRLDGRNKAGGRRPHSWLWVERRADEAPKPAVAPGQAHVRLGSGFNLARPHGH